MRYSQLAVLASIAFTIHATPSIAIERSDAKMAIALMQKAQTYLQQNGVEKAIIEFNRLDSPFNSKSTINPYGDLYLFTLDSKGYQAVHGKNPKIRGKFMLEMRDIDGVYLIEALVKICFSSKEGKGWTKYRWPNPITKEVEPKQGYAERVPGMDLCIGTGIYQ
ncbi:cache domain-containing protein [Undibacterium flavidum]|uniref:Cache domain-containing protein n=1 Tax=Undibacterium flavidum TaxID=2762297 RepID=A0ABR6YAQ7_9BURK|nr:cache domain-containing protein [Undibacterium flavidum]MBC3873234.1 cache domain-containing protein [Undibacterium flavidum]